MQDAKEEVREKLSIEDIIGEYVQLKRAGRYWRGLSPFTNERTPSFFVTPEKNIWHDFSSGKGGDIYAFIMEVEGLSFREALELLARKANVDLSQYQNSGSKTNGELRKRYLEINSLARKYFMHQMVKSKTAQEYIFKKRGLKKETVIEWGIGFAPQSGGAAAIARKKGFSDKEIRGAGLISSYGRDIFRSRMMIPLCDGQGQVVGFTGRIVGDGEPKYINTPATMLYDKGRQVFGLHLAKNAIRQADLSVLVEGNLDVISSHQAGIKNVVACAGTALTISHLKSLSRLSQNIALCFDADRAGVAATERAVNLAQDLEVNLSVISLNNAKDPDELIQKDVKLWEAAITARKPAVQWLIDYYASQNDLTTAEGKKTLTNTVLKIVAKLKDTVELEHYLNKISELTETSRGALEAKLNNNNDNIPKQKLKPVKVKKDQSRRNYDKKYFIQQILAITFSRKNLRTILNNLSDNFLDENYIKIKNSLLNEDFTNIDETFANSLAEIELIAEIVNKQKGDKRSLLLTYMRDLELLFAEEERGKLSQAFIDSDGEDTIEINKAIKQNNKKIRDLKSTGVNDDFAKLFEIWQARKNKM